MVVYECIVCRYNIIICGYVLMSVVYFIDVDIRRRVVCDFVQVFCKSFEGSVIQNFFQYVQGFLQVQIIIYAVFIIISYVVMRLIVIENKKYFLKVESLIIMFDQKIKENIVLVGFKWVYFIYYFLFNLKYICNFYLFIIV